MKTTGLGTFDPNTLPMDAFILGGARGALECPITLKAPWTFGLGTKVLSTTTYTLEAGVEYVLVDIADAVMITIPEGLPLLRGIVAARRVASTNSITFVRSGSDTVEGATTFVTHGPYAASTLSNAEVTLRKMSSTGWLFTAGVVSGSDGDGSWQRFPDGTELTVATRWK